MKKLVVLALALMLAFALVGCGDKAAPSGDASKTGAATEEKVSYQYKTADEVKEMVATKAPLILLDIVPKADYDKGHLPGSIATYAYPADTPELQEKLAEHTEKLKSASEPIIVVCPGGGTGAKNTIDYYVSEGVPADNLYILEGGAKGWPYAQMYVTD